MKRFITYHILAIFSIFFLWSCSKEVDNYGPVDLSLLSKLTWLDYSRTYWNGPQPLVRRYKWTPKPSDSTYYLLLVYSCDASSCDTFYRPDTVHFDTYSLIGDTLSDLTSGLDASNDCIITKLTEDEMVIYEWDRYDHLQRNSHPLVTQGTGVNSGKDTIDYP